jgi:hypothetical protein
MDEVFHLSSPFSRTVAFLRAHKRLAGTCAALLLGVLFMDWVTPLGVTDGMLYAFIVLLSAQGRERRFILALAAISTVFIGVGYVLSPPGAALWISLVNRCLALTLVWMTAGLLARRLHVEEERDVALREQEEAQAHIAYLRGLLPICAWCKKIRAADGTWVKLENYISQHSDANFTHAICPECKDTVVRENPDAHGADSSAQL